MNTLLHHPVRTIEHEAQHLRELEREGESAETPLVALLGVATVVLPLGALMIGLVFLATRLATGAFF